jgi:hypothetical protein
MTVGELLGMLLTSGFIAGGLVMWVHHHRVKHEGHRDPPEVSMHAHSIKNSVSSIQGPLRRLAASPDPLRALAEVLRARDERNRERQQGGE